MVFTYNLKLIIGLSNMFLYELDNGLNYNQTLYYLCKELHFMYALHKDMFKQLEKNQIRKYIKDIIKYCNNGLKYNYDNVVEY